ncbi:hypothetical protein GCM10009119_41570 [Algoriphagus jejuensis]|uniref:histidine kinase n=1 Tax=Algoriphagus jejuensis TaxID=419934 RepID=A0ABP3YM33_9BACT
MQDKGINSTFKKIIYESSEIVFLAEGTYPHAIFYANKSFEERLGGSLKDRSLVGLGLDLNAFIFKEELILSHDKRDFSFKLKLPQDSGSDYFLFYQGEEIQTQGLPGKKETSKFFASSRDLIGVGKLDYMTYLNPTAGRVLGYDMEELLHVNLCDFIHEGDLRRIQGIWEVGQKRLQSEFFEVRIKAKDNTFLHLECSVQFSLNSFLLIARDISYRVKQQLRDQKLLSLREKAPELAKIGNWTLDLAKRHWTPASATETILRSLLSKGHSFESVRGVFLDHISGLVSSLVSQQEFNGVLAITESCKLGFSACLSEVDSSEVYGVIWDESTAQQLRAESELHLNLWMESPEALMLVERSGEIFLANKEASLLFGFGKSVPNLHMGNLNVLAEGAGHWAEWLNPSTSNGAVSRFSMHLPGEDGHMLPLEVGSRKLTLNNAEYIALSFRNISEKIHLERKVEASSDFLVNLTEQVPGGLYQLVLNSEGKMNFSFLSKGIETVLGLSQDEIHQFTDISAMISKVHPQDLAAVIMSSIASARKMEPWQCQFRVKSGGDGLDYRWVMGAARPQAMEFGEMVWYGYLTDISKQKEFEAKLDEARMAAEKANKIKSDFLSMISHELRTPLNAISGSVYSLIHEDPTENQKSALNTINFAVDNLIIMINDLLDFQKIEAGKLTIEHHSMNLKSLMEQVVQGLSFHAKDSGNHLALHLSEETDVNVRADKTRLAQVMNNLITNALKFTHEGNIEVKIEVLGQIGDRIRVHCSVEDTGIGIAPEHREKIFNDFDQVKPTFNLKYGGTGLGLSITKKLLNLMGGHIQLESELGKGSRFYFELEFDLVQEVEIQTPINGNLKGSSDSLHLLMAEDNEVNALVLGKIIKKWGYTFNRVYNGREALEAVRIGAYDCVLMDIQMPEMDGFEATMEIKKFSDTPIIALTAAAKLEIIERIDGCEFEGFVAKPIDADELLRKVKEVTAARYHSA